MGVHVQVPVQPFGPGAFASKAEKGTKNTINCTGIPISHASTCLHPATSHQGFPKSLPSPPLGHHSWKTLHTRILFESPTGLTIPTHRVRQAPVFHRMTHATYQQQQVRRSRHLSQCSVVSRTGADLEKHP